MLDRQEYEDTPQDKSASIDMSNAGSLSAELARLDQILAGYLSTLRQRGRSSLGDAVGGAVIEDGEAEGLLGSLYDAHTRLAPDQRIDRWESRLFGLERARQVFSLLPAERDMLLLATAVEIDSRYGRLMAYLNDHVNMTRPTLGLATALLAPDTDAARTTFVERALDGSSIARFGLVELEGDGPVSNRALRVPMSFWPQLIDMRSTPRFDLLRNSEDTKVPFFADTELQTRVGGVTSWALNRGAERKLVNVSGSMNAGANEVAVYVASQLRATTLVVDARVDDLASKIIELARDAAWHQATIVVLHADRLEDPVHRALLARTMAPMVYVTDDSWDAGVLEQCDCEIVELRLPDLDVRALTLAWHKAALDFAVDIDGSALASRFGFGPDRITSALRLASAQSTLFASGAAAQDNIEAACRRMQRTDFGGLAHKLPCPFTESDIVLPEKTSSELDLICTWARHGYRLFADDGIGRNLRTGKGLVCLFSGPPGTGKTMAAQVIGRRLGFDVYRIDLSQVVNKYIGETEKNLARVFDEAQRSKVVLFFDEAETLYGDRTDVKTAQDRFANIEIGYLLQRIETFEGVAILATNLQKNLDEAFLRRLSVVAEFPIPGADERSQIWEILLPPPAERAADVDIDLLSQQFKIAGGDIRNSIFSALLLAAEEDAELGMSQLVRGLWRELQKSGRIVDSAQFGQWRNCIAESA